MTDERFEQLVDEGIEAIPERFLKKLENVAIVIADAPTAMQLRENHVPESDTLLGLYEGVPLIDRGDVYGGLILPDKITIFKEPLLEEAAGDDDALRTLVRETVWHEIAHYFGYDDDAIEEREAKGTNRST